MYDLTPEGILAWIAERHESAATLYLAEVASRLTAVEAERDAALARGFAEGLEAAREAANAEVAEWRAENCPNEAHGARHAAKRIAALPNPYKQETPL